MRVAQRVQRDPLEDGVVHDSAAKALMQIAAWLVRIVAGDQVVADPDSRAIEHGQRRRIEPTGLVPVLLSRCKNIACSKSTSASAAVGPRRPASSQQQQPDRLVAWAETTCALGPGGVLGGGLVDPNGSPCFGEADVSPSRASRLGQIPIRLFANRLTFFAGFMPRGSRPSCRPTCTAKLINEVARFAVTCAPRFRSPDAA